MGIFDTFGTPPPSAAAPDPEPQTHPDADSLAELVGGGMLGSTDLIGDSTHLTEEQREKLSEQGIDTES